MVEKTVGIMGGMGPEAGADLFLKITAATPAQRDQEHLHVILDSSSKTPSRTAALLEGGPDPTPALQASARRLENAGADFLVIACNTAHLFFSRIEEAVTIPVLSIVDETVAHILLRYPEVKTVGILGSDATIRLRLYHDPLDIRGLRGLSPSEAGQIEVQSVIDSVKAGQKGPRVRAQIRAVAERLAAEGAQLLVTACTELPMVLQDGDVGVPVVDPTNALAEAAVHRARS